VRHLALILAVLGALLSGGGVARFAHMTVAHGGERCGAHAASSCGHSHSRSHSGGTNSTPALPAQAPHHDDCPVCNELAVCTPAPVLHSPFIHILAVLAIVHDREAAQLPAPDAPDEVCARPPPSLA
jgi:hypothetical protein